MNPHGYLKRNSFHFMHAKRTTKLIKSRTSNKPVFNHENTTILTEIQTRKHHTPDCDQTEDFYNI